MIHLLLTCMRYADCTAQASTRPFIVSVKRQYLSLPQLLTFFPLRSTRHTPPPIGHLRRTRVFIPVASAPMRRTSHPSGSRPLDVSLLRQTSAPGIFDAPENPRFPAVSNRVQRTDRMAPSRVHLFQGSRQRRRTTRPFGGRPSVMG